MSGQSDNKYGMVVLPLLCALVGAVAFVCFAMATVNTSQWNENETESPSQSEDIVAQLEKEAEDMLQNLTASLSKRDNLSSKVKRTGEELSLLATGDRQLDSDITNEINQLTQAIENERKQQEETQATKDRKDQVVVNIRTIHGGQGGQDDPVFIECIKDAIILQPQQESIPLDQISKSNESFVDHIKSTGYVVFCVRPGGFDSFRDARWIARELGITFGADPFNDDWIINF